MFELSRHVGTVLQDPDGQFIGLTVGEDIAFALENDCTPQAAMREAVDRVAALVGVENHLGHAPHELSGGQKQRVSFAGVMVDEVKVLLFDEPLANLDPATGKQAIELIDDIQRRTGAAVVIIEHRLEDVLWRSVDRIVLMNEGEILADLRPDELLSGSLLSENGIREPLYLTALRYAGVEITPEKKPAHVDSLRLDAADAERVRAWFQARVPEAEPPEKPVLVEARGLGFGYTKERRVLTDVSFAIRRGEMLAIVGRNGAGKSTLSKLICGFEAPNEGTLFFNGRDMSADSIRERAAHIGYVMQNPNQMISKTMIFDEVALGLATLGLSAEETRARVEDTLRVCGLYPFRNWPISALSFGQKKRVTIASVLAMGPDLIILDEPTAGQDFRHYTEIMEFLRGLNAQGRNRCDDHPRHAPDAGIHASRAGIQRGTAHCRQIGRRRAVRSGAGRAGGAQGNQPVHVGRPGGYRAAGNLCGTLHRLRQGGAQPWPPRRCLITCPAKARCTPSRVRRSWRFFCSSPLPAWSPMTRACCWC